MPKSVLQDYCNINTNFDADTFVGIRAEHGEISINFPLGFRLAKSDKGIRRDIMLLLNVLAKLTDRKDSVIDNEINYADLSLPVQAYLYVISDYFTRGYYKQFEPSYKVSGRGRIDWTRTVKNQKPYIQGGEVFYIDYITRQNNVNENEIITLIHEYCVHESFQKFGWLFTTYVPNRPRIKFNRRLFTSAVSNKIKSTFNDRNRELLKNMLAIIKFLGDDGAATDYKYGTLRFEYVWEKLIDTAYGIKNKTDYFPKTIWVLEDGKYENSFLEPDTIMVLDKSVYVLDAKYYKYGSTGAPAHLPDSSSINKQITYGEYIAEADKFKDSSGNNPSVYNAFLMPYNSHGTRLYTGKNIYYIGSAFSDWKSADETKTYEKIAGILIDVKSLMKNYSHSNDKILSLAKIIEENVSKDSK